MLSLKYSLEMLELHLNCLLEIEMFQSEQCKELPKRRIRVQTVKPQRVLTVAVINLIVHIYTNYLQLSSISDFFFSLNTNYIHVTANF